LAGLRIEEKKSSFAITFPKIREISSFMTMPIDSWIFGLMTIEIPTYYSNLKQTVRLISAGGRPHAGNSFFKNAAFLLTFPPYWCRFNSRVNFVFNELSTTVTTFLHQICNTLDPLPLPQNRALLSTSSMKQKFRVLI
jgi:hypothetical protein